MPTSGSSFRFPYGSLSCPLVVLAGTLAVLAVGGFGCHPSNAAKPGSSEPGEPPWFQDITEASGLHFVHDAGVVDHKYFVPQIMGSGAALFDYDNDGRLDILLLQNGGPNSGSTNRLFHQEPDGRFVDVSAGSGLDFAGYCMGVAIGDVNNDGLPDVLITEFRGARLFLNNGNGTFRDVTREAGLDNPLWGTSASFLDYDRDGWLDLVIVNYVDYDASQQCPSPVGSLDYCPPKRFAGSVTKLYHNLGAAGASAKAKVRFEDVTLKSGLGRLPGPGLGVLCADFDGDGWPDILVANDGQANRLWINHHDGTFKEEAMLRGVASTGTGLNLANMGVAIGDVAGDAMFGLFITHLTEETNTLWRQKPRGYFRDWTGASGLLNGRWRGTGFGTVLADFDHDGALDLAIVNGRIARSPKAGDERTQGYWEAYAERNQLFANDGQGHFVDRSQDQEPFCANTMVSRGLAWGDIDGDGGVDLLVTTVAGPARLYRNVAPKKGHWLMVRAVDPALHRDAYGATITVASGGRRRLGWILPGQSYLCSGDPRCHFGLGPADHVDRISVLWPDGTQEFFPGCSVDRTIVLTKGRGKKT